MPSIALYRKKKSNYTVRVRACVRPPGVDMVLNSLAEEKLQASLRCLARHGRFLEIGKYDLSNNSPLGQ